MSTAVIYPHVVKVDGKPACLEHSPRIRVAQIVVNYRDLGNSTEEVCTRYQHLKLAEVHSALAYYFDHQAEVDAEIEEEQRMIDESYKNAKPTPVEIKLRTQGLLPHRP
jgi:uncharacterized protein (DUF433 family)